MAVTDVAVQHKEQRMALTALFAVLEVCFVAAWDLFHGQYLAAVAVRYMALMQMVLAVAV